MFFHRLWYAFWWKYFVFLCPSVNHLTHARCFHISSSFSNHFWTYLLAALWACGFLRRGFNSSRLLSSYYAFLNVNFILPKVAQFHWVNCHPHYLNILGTLGFSSTKGCCPHADSIIFKQVSLPIHIDSNWKGFDPLCKVPSPPSVFSQISEWFE